ncbi:hypothetical protein [Streptosporangium roseum]|uniref:Uncharacterized protein n=1 Tax=Streptosporangium roseum (strain ATCC 12428 / DSM 43021 / JCM 3005 / KCTC 9067 / NCIMB 10171 / NRRL 2505 / NI 9100) TaxID=479432 RepID=D2B569_STRRD|nr:hypothetical protein [Streptosporangium roseum]ACZ87593.1 hypothetical protein Sros_4760 [Streptosporangium roseum DSM 43021]
MKRNLRRWGALGAAAVSLAGAMVVTGGATSAHADTRCSVNAIAINAGPGGEPKALAWGHSHKTGNHYVQSSKWSSFTGKYLWQWMADNNGGNDGDTADTYYGPSFCDNPAW